VKHPIVTVDGPAGAGKSTVARRLAQRLGYGFVPSGAIYRALAWRVAGGVPVKDALRTTTIELRGTPEAQRVAVNGEDVTEALRAPHMSGLTSALSQDPEVRAYADALQRRFAAGGPVVVEGRDAGTVVFPNADCKFYLDAALPVRAARRLADRRARGEAAELAAVQEALAARDEADRRRPIAPLARHEEAIYIDSSGLDIDEVVDLMVKEVERVCCTRS
jgi:cytidylate kinase